MRWSISGGLLALLATTVSSWPYDESLLEYNLNQNKDATDPAEYWGEWPDHKGKYHASPDNWRFPFYTLFLDRFVNGDPTNDNINGTQFEHDINSNQMRHGGDVAGLVDTLDYLQGMGIKALYLAGTSLMNQPWGFDGYSALDTTLLDQHYGTLQVWRDAITEIHKRGMYVVFDNTIATMGDLIGFDGHLNTTTPFNEKEYKTQWKSERRYVDFDIGNSYNDSCNYPRFWFENGYPVNESQTAALVGCYDSDFDQYGDIEAFGVYPDWKRQLAKFASVQDRLREWEPTVRERLIQHSCMIIASLDIDGFRYDKATQSTVEALGEMSAGYRECARAVGKENFFISGEITGGNTFGSIYLGRGRQPNQLPDNAIDSMKLTNESDSQYFLREIGHEAIDGAAFHYSIYRMLTRFLGMDGQLAAGFDLPVDWVEAWNTMMTTNDLINPNTGKFDPRHMFGATNQDVFRWPSIKDGVQRQLLGSFITTLLLPGIPLALWGEEQAFYVLDATAENYIYGRQAMSPATAWRSHGCFALDSGQYYQWPIEAARYGCHNESVAYDHRDPSHPVRNIMKHMYQLRELFPVLNDGYTLTTLSKSTEDVVYPGSNGTVTETGIWSVVRDVNINLQDLGSDTDNQPVWLVYQNTNRTIDWKFDCSDNDTALIAPFDEGTTVKNLFYPHDEIKLEASPKKLGLNGSSEYNGCTSKMSMKRYEFRAYVPKSQFKTPRSMVTGFTPGHDAPVLSTVAPNLSEDLPIELYFSEKMDCDSITKSLSLNSSTESGNIAKVDKATVNCSTIDATQTSWAGQIPSRFVWSAKLTDVYNGVHRVTLKNASNADGDSFTGAVDHFLFRIGQIDNPMVFTTANYSTSLLHQHENNDTLFIQHHAAGAEKYRYSTNWGTTFSPWRKYTGGNDTAQALSWSGTSKQAWKGNHVRVEYWSSLTGSSDYVQEGDSNWHSDVPRRFPHAFFNGPYNQYGYDGGLDNNIQLDTEDGYWKYHFTSEWPAVGQINIWGVNPDGKPDQSWVLGDADGDNILDRMPPSSLSSTLLNITKPPPSPYLSWKLYVNDATQRYDLIPVGKQTPQIVMFVLFWIIPVLTGVGCVYIFMKSFYKVKFNENGVTEKSRLGPMVFLKKLKPSGSSDRGNYVNPLMRLANKSGFMQSTTALGAAAASGKRRMVLIATMEYDIEDWAIKIKIGGLGVMAQLMGKTLGHQDLIWVVPCVGGVDYPVDRVADPMTVKILGSEYQVQVQYHTLKNITYVLLDAPVFRQQSKSEPYPARMDDLDSAVYYSAWNQCIAQAIKRFPIDLYHINDYHGSVAPLYLLPETIPACLSLHNAEFQGLWPMRTQKERREVCDVFNLEEDVARRYVQFGEVFNLLHAGASYLRVQQQGFGAVGVSKKYGKRSYARYPIFWGLRKVGNLPNPDPSDVGEWTRQPVKNKDEDILVDAEYEAGRGELKRQAQEWAGLEQNPDADLMVFVGRWSMQKGVDLIADAMPAVLEARPNVQVICIGPVIDLYGKFAALKLARMMEVYPGRVFSKPEFTALPPFIFSGAEFALIPSRDEPFGLVAVEFGRKGALGIGARVGGLGQMPGWWYNVESTSTSHLLVQFKLAIDAALSSKQDTRAMMRARSAKQRFPVAQWVEDLEILQTTAIAVHDREVAKGHGRPLTSSGTSTPNGASIQRDALSMSPLPSPGLAGMHSREASYSTLNQINGLDSPRVVSYSRDLSPHETEKPQSSLNRSLSLGVRSGPGHRSRRGRRNPVEGVVDEHENENSTSTNTPSDSSDDEEMAHSIYGDDEYTMTPAEVEEGRRRQAAERQTPAFALPSTRRNSQESTHARFLVPPGSPGSPKPDQLLLPPSKPFSESNRYSNASVLSLDSVVGNKKDFKLQKVDPFFTDGTGEYYHNFETKLQDLNGSNSEADLCIEEFLIKSEQEWFDRFRNAKLGRNNPKSPTPSVFRGRNNASPAAESYNDEALSHIALSESHDSYDDEFLLGKDYVPPTGLRKWMQIKIGDWPVYSIFLALGQIIAANSYQITLLTGEVGESAEKLYGIATTYAITSVCWWLVFRYFKCVVCLSTPWFFYGLAFLLIGSAHWQADEVARGWIQNIGSGCYAAASSSGSIFFASNFGDEGGAPVETWIFRACVIQGIQQAYVIGLWYWGSTLTKASSEGILNSDTMISNTWKMSAICYPIAIFLWGMGLLLVFGLPNYYRQKPGKVPSFYKSLFRRKIVLWNFVAVILQNFFMSAPYGRNWSFLWSSEHTHAWEIVILCIVFFGVVWCAFLFIVSKFSKKHSWFLPVFACGLGAPRFIQIWWGISGIGYYLPWVGGGYTAGALASRSIWLWLGVLDSIQGLGFGVILLQTLTRVHMCFALIASQVLGSIATICARAFGPNRVGPGPISPDITKGAGELANAWFWIALSCQLLICAGFLLFFRKEQLSKP